MLSSNDHVGKPTSSSSEQKSSYADGYDDYTSNDATPNYNDYVDGCVKRTSISSPNPPTIRQNGDDQAKYDSSNDHVGKPTSSSPKEWSTDQKSPYVDGYDGYTSNDATPNYDGYVDGCVKRTSISSPNPPTIHQNGDDQASYDVHTPHTHTHTLKRAYWQTSNYLDASLLEIREVLGNGLPRETERVIESDSWKRERDIQREYECGECT
jgi:hypothetical protein